MTEFVPNLNVEIQAFVIAGGRGSRMGELSSEKQKCMLEVMGVPILGHILESLNRVFGARAEVIMGTGYKSEQIKDYFGDTYRGMKIKYVHGPTELPTTRRLLLAKDLIVKSFLFLAGDILTPNVVLEQIASDSSYVGQKNSQGVVSLGVISGAKDHSPALSHALLTPKDGYLDKITFPPTEKYGKEDLREMHRAIYSLVFLDLLSKSLKTTISEVIGEAISYPGLNFLLSEYEGEWAHYVKPEDLVRYRNPSFLK